MASSNETSNQNMEPTDWSDLRTICNSCLDYFSTHQDETGLKIKDALKTIVDKLDELMPLYLEISNIAPLFDFDENTPGNGYRSFLYLIDRCISQTITACKNMFDQKNSMLFRKSNHMRDVEAYSRLLVSLGTCLEHMKTLYSWRAHTEDGNPSLFPLEEHSPQELLYKAESIDQYSFYGRCLGFQFCDSMKPVLKIVSLGMASFSELYYANGTLIGRCSNSLQYLMDPDARARRIVSISKYADVYFCKAFWHLNESDLLPQMVMPGLAINQLISIPPEELECPTLSGKSIKIPIPNSHIGKKPIRVRLLSAKRRIGMVGSGSAKGQLSEPSNCLLIHCHGGGFVAQSSRSHESYMRTWTNELDVPIVSIDYSLAPTAPYPRALEEVLYAYVWILQHASSLLGSTAEKVILVGDSAGANLNLVTTLRCLELDIRVPDGIFMAYIPVIVEFVPTPSRLLSLGDTILLFGFLVRCLKAYAVTDPKKENDDSEMPDELIELDCSDKSESFAEVSESDLIALALSPNDDEDRKNHKIPSLPSDSTLNSVSLSDTDDFHECTEHSMKEKKTQENDKKNLNSSSSFTIDNGNNESQSNGVSSSWSVFPWSKGNRTPRRLGSDAESGRKPYDDFAFSVPKDPHLSPYRASEELIKKLPPVKILTTHLDPCLDDCVMFAKKLKSQAKSVTLDIISGLPHGFLNLSVVSKEAHEGSLLCAKRIRELMENPEI